MAILDDGNPGMEDGLDVLAAGEEGLDDLGHLLAVSLHLQGGAGGGLCLLVSSHLGPLSSQHSALGVKHQTRRLLGRPGEWRL